jgi:FMN phosphatase YigB (HAD superfamily)
MIKLALFDLGETLIHGDQPFPHVITALRAISQFHTEENKPLILGLVSDFLSAEPPVTETKIAAREKEYQKILEGAGLREFFEPFSSRVTLSTRAGVNKPDRRIFELAIQRSETGASLSECSFVTENADHLSKCKEFGMRPVRFGSGPGITPAFSDWADAAATFAVLVNPESENNRALANVATLDARYNLVDFKPSGRTGGREIKGRAKQLVPINDPKLGELSGLYVELPSDVTVMFDQKGLIEDVAATPPDADEVADVSNYVLSLARTKAIAQPGQPARGATHFVEKDSAGRRRLVRRGYRAF